MSIRILRRNGCLPIAVAIVLIAFGKPASAQVSQSPSTDSCLGLHSSQATSGGEGGGLEKLSSPLNTARRTCKGLPLPFLLLRERISKSSRS